MSKYENYINLNEDLGIIHDNKKRDDISKIVNNISNIIEEVNSLEIVDSYIKSSIEFLNKAKSNLNFILKRRNKE